MTAPTRTVPVMKRDLIIMENSQMPAKTTKEKAKPRSTSASKELSKYGIKRVSTDHFYYGDYKYTDLKDAIAQAKRDLNTAVT